MRLATVAQSRDIDLISEESYGLSGEVLMESAGALAAREVDQSYFPEIKKGLTAVICGPGNNGADGLVLTRHLHSAGHRNVIAFYQAPKNKRSKLFNQQLERLELHGIRALDLEANPEKIEQIRSASLIIDSLFGIGLKRNVEGEFLKLIDVMNSCKVPVISLDCPSGLDCDRGMVMGGIVKANMTLTFGLAKPGFFTADGPHHVGKLRVVPIGYSYECLRQVATTHFAFTERLARRYLPAHKDRSHKYTHGKLLVIAGKEGMWGAGVLTAMSAYRIGTGHVTWASFDEPSKNILEAPEVLTASVDDESLWEKDRFSAVVIGPGLGVSEATAALIEKLKKINANVVVDADAIATCVEHNLFPLPKSWIMTPHAGELSKMIKWDSRDIEVDRFGAAQEGSKKSNGHVLLKGFRSILSHKDRCLVINSGNSALAKAGTGDVLTGMIGGLLAQGLEPVQATATAAYVHGRMADEWVRVGHHKNSLTASDLKDHLPLLMGRLAGGSLV